MSESTADPDLGDPASVLRRKPLAILGLALFLAGLVLATDLLPDIGIALTLLLVGPVVLVWGQVVGEEHLPVLAVVAVAPVVAASMGPILGTVGLRASLTSAGFAAVVIGLTLAPLVIAWYVYGGLDRLWAFFGLALLLVAVQQLYGPLPALRPTVLLGLIGFGAITWDACLQRARWVLDVSDRYAWPLLVAFAFLAAALQLGGLLNDYWTTVGIQLFIFAVLALSWDIVGGQTGYSSFGNMAFFGVGAYTSAILFKTYGLSLPVSFVAAALAALLFAGIIGIIVLRLRGHYFAIATLGVLLASLEISRNLEITGGSSGLALFESPGQNVFYFSILGVLIAQIAVVRLLLDTRFGYVLNTIRDDERKATAMGINTTYYKTAAWMIAALFTGLVGAMWAPYNLFVDPPQAFNLGWNVELIVGAFLGGTGTLAGPVLGAFGLRGLILMVESLFTGWQLVILGLVVIVTVIKFPDGVVGQLHERASSMEYYKHGGGAAGGQEPDEPDQPAAADGGEPPR